MTEVSPVARRKVWTGWSIFAAIGLCLVLLMGRYTLPLWRQTQFLGRVEEAAGSVVLEEGGPEWLRDVVGDNAMKGFDVVREVDLTDARLTGGAFRPLSEFPEVKSVRLQLSEIDLAVLESLSELPSLEVLDLFESNLDNAGLKTLAGSRSIRKIMAGYTNVTDAGLSHAGRMTQLEYFGVRGDDVTDSGLAHLANLRNLKGLYLGETKITDDGLIHLASLKSLESLWIYDTAVTERGLLQVAGDHPALKKLTVSEGQVTAVGLDELYQQCPGIKIAVLVPQKNGKGYSGRRRPVDRFR